MEKKDALPCQNLLFEGPDTHPDEERTIQAKLEHY